MWQKGKQFKGLVKLLKGTELNIVTGSKGSSLRLQETNSNKNLTRPLTSFTLQLLIYCVPG